MKLSLLFLTFMDCAFGVIAKNAFLNQLHEDFLMFFPKRFVVLVLLLYLRSILN